MQKNYVISDSAQRKVEESILGGRFWIAFDSNIYYLENEHVDLFLRKREAILFAARCMQHAREYHIFYASSLVEVYRKLAGKNRPTPTNKSVRGNSPGYQKKKD